MLYTQSHQCSSGQTCSGGNCLGGAGAGGSGGAGGAAGTGGAGGAGCANCQVAVETNCQNGTSTQTVALYLDLLNNSPVAVPLSQVTFRYWFTLGETTDAPVASLDYSQRIPAGDFTFKYVAVTPAVTGANEYLEVGFKAAAGSLAVAGDTGQIQLRMNSAAYNISFDPSPTTDYSFQTCASGQTADIGPFEQQSTVTAYINGVLSSGVEP